MNKFEELFKFTFNAAFCGSSSVGRRFLGRRRPPVVELCIAQFLKLLGSDWNRIVLPVKAGFSPV